MVTEAIDLHTRWPEMTLEEKPRVAELMVRTIVIEDGEIESNLVQLPSYQEITKRQNRYHPSLLQNLQDARSRRVFSSHDGGAFIASDHPWL